MNRVTPVVLLALLVLAGTWVAVFELRRAAERPEAFVETVFAPAPADLEAAFEMTLRRKDAALELAKGPGGLWRLTSPVEGFAREGFVDGLVRDVLLLRKSGGDIPKELLSAKGLPVYGLEPPRLVVSVRAGRRDAPKTFELLVGDADPTQRYVYARRPGDAGVMLVDKYVLDRLDVPLREYRETRFARFDKDRAASLKLRSAQAKLEFEKKDGSWRVTKPFADRTASLPMEDVLRTLGSVEARAFLAESAGNLGRYGFDLPRVEAAFTRDDNTTTTLLLGATCNDPVGTVYAKLADAPTIYAVDESLVEKLTFPSDAIRERRLAMVSSFGVREIVIERPGAKIVVRRERVSPAASGPASGKWVVAEPVKCDAEEGAVDRFVEDVAKLDILRFPYDAPDDAALERCGLDEKSRATLTLKLVDPSTGLGTSKPDLVFDFGKVDEKQKDLYLRRRALPGVCTVSESFAARINAGALEFRVRKVADIRKSDIRKIALARPQGPSPALGTSAVTVEKGADDKWRMTAPVLAPADEINVGNLCDDLNDFSALKFLVEKAENLAAYGLDPSAPLGAGKPLWEIAVGVQTGKDKPVETKTILVGKEIPGEGFAAKMQDADVVFVVSNTFVAHAGAELRQRIVWQANPRDVTALVWSASGGVGVRASVRREGNDWKLIEPSGGTLTPFAIDQIVESIANLRVERFEAYTKADLAKFGLDPSAALGAGKPRGTIALTVAGRERVLFIGAAKDRDNVYACVSTDDAIFTLPQALATMLLRSPVAASAPPPFPAP